jgi:hypothetical protein
MKPYEPQFLAKPVRSRSVSAPHQLVLPEEAQLHLQNFLNRNTLWLALGETRIPFIRAASISGDSRSPVNHFHLR